MYNKKQLDELRKSLEQWEETSLSKALASLPERRDEFITTSSEPIDRLYTPLDVAEDGYASSLGLPGEYPFTRGVHPTLHRSKLWTMRMVAGFGTAEETNQRFKYLLEQGQTGLSVAFDLATLMGYDTDQPEALGEFGKCGVAISSLKDMEILLDGIPLDKVSTSMTINSPAAIIWAMYIAAAEKQGVRPDQLRGTIQNDILKEFIAQKEYIFPPEPSMRLVVDTMEFGSQKVPQWNTISISGYHIREAGSTAAQELAFTLGDGLEYVRWGIARGMDVDEFAPRLSFFFNAHNDFFEEIAKYRAARRIWARELRDTFGAKNPKSMLMRTHTQTAGVSLTAQQPLVNIVRTTIEALAGVLGGTQSLHTNSFDEALALPTEEAVRIALRTQQVIAHESGVTNTVDPLGGSYFVEKLTDEMEAAAYDYFARIDELGGMVAAIESNFPQREIADAAFEHQAALEKEERIMVGVNAFRVDDDELTEIHRPDPAAESRQKERLAETMARRDDAAAEAALAALERAAAEDRNLMPLLVDCARARVSEGEMVAAMQRVFGTYTETPVY